MTGSLPDMNLSLDLFEQIGKLRRSANTSARPGQMDELLRIADEIVQWQIRLRKAIVFALGTNNMTDSWSSIVKQIAECRHERDGAQQLHQTALDEIIEYTHKLADAQARLEVLRAQARMD